MCSCGLSRVERRFLTWKSSRVITTLKGVRLTPNTALTDERWPMVPSPFTTCGLIDHGERQ